MTDILDTPTTMPPPPGPRPLPPVRRRRDPLQTGLIALAALVVTTGVFTTGVLAGAASGEEAKTAPDQTGEVAALEATLTDTEAELEEAEGALSDSEGKRADLEGDLDDVQGQLDDALKEPEPVVEEEEAPEPEPEPEPEVTLSQEQAIASAESYLDFMAFSRTDLISQLEYEQFSHADAVYAVDHISVNWNEQAAASAASYLDTMAFSRGELIDQLVYEGFTVEQATYGVNQTGAMNTPRLWLIPVVVGIVASTLLAGPTTPGTTAVPGGHGDTERRVCVNGEHDYQRPTRMATRFKDGDYCNAAGTTMPDWVLVEAKQYVRAHPWVAPDGAAPRTRGDSWDWSWLNWVGDRLTTGRCLAWHMLPATWIGCDSQPHWVDVVRRVEVYCGGHLILIAAGTRNGVAALIGAGVCAWTEINSEFSGSWRNRR